MTDLLVDAFQAHRGRLFGIAYRMLGTVADAEDVLQDAWLRWQGTDREAVLEPAAFLSTIVTRLSLTALDSARARREVYVGPWLPEPILTGAAATNVDPSEAAEHAESLSMAVLLLLERLSPAERAAYVLHEAFDYPFRQVAEVLETSEANARQLATRARQHLDRERGAVVTPEEHDRVLGAFLAAAQSGDLGSLEAVLTEHVQSVSDGGGVVSAARRIVRGRDNVASIVKGLTAKYYENMTFEPVEANGASSLLGVVNGVPVVLVTVDAAPDGVRSLFAVLNPLKLRAFEAFAAAVTSGEPAQS
jgi:RNA polymerase sigma-70 factor (ECF subfamily)